MIIRKVNLHTDEFGRYAANFHNVAGKVDVNSLKASLDIAYANLKLCKSSTRAIKTSIDLKNEIAEQELVVVDCLIAEAVCNHQSHVLKGTNNFQLLKKYTYTDVHKAINCSSLSTVTRYLRDDCIQAVVHGRTFVLNSLLEQSGDHDKLYLAIEALRHLSSQKNCAIEKISTQKVMDVLESFGKCRYQHRAMHSVMDRAKNLFLSERELNTLFAMRD